MAASVAGSATCTWALVTRRATPCNARHPHQPAQAGKADPSPVKVNRCGFALAGLQQQTFSVGLGTPGTSVHSQLRLGC